MRMPNFPYLLRYLMAVGLMAFTTAIFLAVRDALSLPVIALLYLLSVGFSTALWGLGPGITSAFCAFFTFNYFFIQPYFTMAVHRPSDLVMLLVFLIVAVVISQLVGRAQIGLAAARAREHEATQLYELSTILAGFHDEQTIAHALLEHVQALYKGEHVELNVAGEHPLTFHLPSHTLSPPRPPDFTVSIQATQGVMMDIRLWRTKSVATPEEKRMLQTFASQGALALERAWLAQSESRAQALEESDRLKSVILSSVSHELRTPLSTIKAAVTSLRSGEVDWESSARAELLAAIDDESDHLDVLVGNLLDMSRLETGALRPQRQWNILSEIVGSTLQRMRSRTEKHKLEIDIPEGLPLVPVDYVQIEQVFTNLLSNSLKYSPPGTVIRIKAHTVEDSMLLVQVINQSPPVPPEHLNRIFDKFYRITAAERVSGIGLGLSICKGIVEAHGGRIWAENLPGGFAFNFTLPLVWEGILPPYTPEEMEVA